MQPRAEYVVLDLDLRTEVVDESVEGGAVRCTQVRGGDDAERGAPEPEALELRLEQSEAVPLHEGADEVDFVGRVDLGTKLRAKRWLAVRVSQECGVRQRRTRPDRAVGGDARPYGGIQRVQLTRWLSWQQVVVLGESLQQIVD
ncbi:hypothetical protein [Kribbella aluminosa]|uniref:hypothetical protein n=1 Tax=Kribbella aluminosa TaxID=416017 RepID=UPI003CD05AA2